MVIALIGETVSKNNNKIHEIAKYNMHGRVALFVTSRGGEGILHSFGEGSSISTILLINNDRVHDASVRVKVPECQWLESLTLPTSNNTLK